MRFALSALALAVLCLLPLLSPAALAADPPAQGKIRVFEMRKYYTHPGRLDALNKRFREHTNKLFVKHGMELVGYWTPKDQPDVLIYILAYPSKDAAEASWKAFRDDPEWKKAAAESEKDGKIVAKVESTFMDPTDYSPIK